MRHPSAPGKSPPTAVSQPGFYPWQLLKEAGRWTVRHRWAVVVFLGTVCLAAYGLAQFEPELLRWIQIREPSTIHLARQISLYGELLYTGGAVLILLLGAGFLLRSARFRRMAIAAVVAAAVAGILANIPRGGLARPRPSTEAPDRFYWLEFDHDYQSFPSAHAATSLATAGFLVVALPPAGVVFTAWAGAVCWSRMENDRHYPSDILAGACFGLLCGLAFSQSFRRIERQREACSREREERPESSDESAFGTATKDSAQSRKERSGSHSCDEGVSA